MTKTDTRIVIHFQYYTERIEGETVSPAVSISLHPRRSSRLNQPLSRVTFDHVSHHIPKSPIHNSEIGLHTLVGSVEDETQKISAQCLSMVGLVFLDILP